MRFKIGVPWKLHFKNYYYLWIGDATLLYQTSSSQCHIPLGLDVNIFVSSIFCFMYSNFHSPSIFFLFWIIKKRFYDLLVFEAAKILNHFFPFLIRPFRSVEGFMNYYFYWTSSCKNEFPWRISSYLFSRILFIHSLIHLNAFGRLIKWFTKPSNNNRCQWIVTN